MKAITIKKATKATATNQAKPLPIGAQKKYTQLSTTKKTAPTKPTTTKVAPKKIKKTAYTSTSGKYRSLRHLMESLLTKTKDITFEKVLPIVKKEFPNSKFDVRNFSWYKSQIVSNKVIKNL